MAVNFYNDFIEFLKYIEKKPIKRTAKGNISLQDISAFRSILSDKSYYYDHERFNWKIATESHIQNLHQIRILAEGMCLIYKRKFEFRLSKNGKGFIHNIGSIIQYEIWLFGFGKV